MIDAGLSRGVVNHRVSRIKRVFRWAVAEELLPPSAHQTLAAVEGLRKGRTTAREPEPIAPAPDDVVEATLPHLPEVVADMVRFQRSAAAKKAGGAKKAHARPASADRAQAQAVTPQEDTAIEPPTFVDDTAQRTGQAKRTVQNDLAIAANISDKAAQLLLGTPVADSKAQLRRLAKLPAKDQLKVAKRISTGKAETVQKALQPSGDGQDTERAETLKKLKAAVRTLTRELGVFDLYDKYATALQQIHDDLEAIL